jgi:hypothetical protein
LHSSGVVVVVLEAVVVVGGAGGELLAVVVVAGGDGGGCGGEVLIAVLVTVAVDGGGSGGGGGSTTGAGGGVGGGGGGGCCVVCGVSRLGMERGVSSREPEVPAFEEPLSDPALSGLCDGEPECEPSSGAEYSSTSISASASSSSVPTRAGVPRLPDPFPAGGEEPRPSRLPDLSSSAGAVRRSSWTA